MLLAFTGESVAATFVVTAGMCGALAQFLFMGLIGVVLAAFVNIFRQNDAFQFVVSFIGVIVFTGLTVYAAQRLKSVALATPAGETGAYAICSRHFVLTAGHIENRSQGPILANSSNG